MEDNTKDIVEVFIANEPNLHSKYVRGSVSDGRAVKGISDVDCIAVINYPIVDVRNGPHMYYPMG